MEAIRTIAEQVHEFGSFLYSYKADDRENVDVYRMDTATNAEIHHTGNHNVIRVTFIKSHK